jgi:hypothetical protein
MMIIPLFLTYTLVFAILALLIVRMTRSRPRQPRQPRGFDVLPPQSDNDDRPAA